MNTKPSYPKCDEASIKRIINLVDTQIQQSNILICKPRKKYLRVRKLTLVATLALLSLSSLAFAANIDFPELLNKAYNQLFPNKTMADKALNYMQPLEGSRVFNGIKAEMIGYIRDSDVVYLTFSLQDLEGNRLDESTFIYDYSLHAYNVEAIDPYGSNSIYSFQGGTNILHTSPVNMPEITLVNYDASTKTAIFNYRFSNPEAMNFLEDDSQEFYKKLELTLNLIASGAKEGEASFDFGSLLKADSHTPSTLKADFDDFRRNGPIDDSHQLQTLLTPDETSLTLLNVPGVTISNYGIIDGRLHVLIKYDRPRDLTINRILDMTLKSSQKVWNAEYDFDLPTDYTSDDLQVLYHYRTYDYIMGMSDTDFMNLQESEAKDALWKLAFSPTAALEERSIPYKIQTNGKITHEATAYISSIGLMIPQPLDSYGDLYDKTFNHNMSLTFLLEDGTTKTTNISNVTGYTTLDQTGKTKFLFSEFVTISNIKEVILTLP